MPIDWGATGSWMKARAGFECAGAMAGAAGRRALRRRCWALGAAALFAAGASSLGGALMMILSRDPEPKARAGRC